MISTGNRGRVEESPLGVLDNSLAMHVAPAPRTGVGRKPEAFRSQPRIRGGLQFSNELSCQEEDYQSAIALDYCSWRRNELVFQ